MASSPSRNFSWSSTTRMRNGSITPLPDLGPPTLPAAVSPRPACRVPAVDVTVQLPPSSSARSRIDDSPTPGAAAGARPTPVSWTRTRSASASSCRVTVQDSAALWRAALFTASITIRYAATSTAAGSGPISSSAATDQLIPDRRAGNATARLCSSARCLRADTRPSWSRAGGRRPSTSRRTSAISSRAWSESWSNSSAARSGSSARRSRAASSRIASVAREGPRPSWRSRRTRRRSSSRAVMRCWRDSCRSRLIDTAWTRAPTWLPTSSRRRRSAGAERVPGRVHLEPQPTHERPAHHELDHARGSARLSDRGLDRCRRPRRTPRWRPRTAGAAWPGVPASRAGHRWAR